MLSGLPSLPHAARLLALTFTLAAAAHAQGTSEWSRFPEKADAAAQALEGPASLELTDPDASASSTADTHSPSTLGNPWVDAGNHRHTSGTHGSIGLLRVGSADLGRGGLVRLSATGEYLRAGDFPVEDALNTRTAGTFAISYVPLDFVEFYLGYGAFTNTNSASFPGLIQSVGDLTLGGKVTKRWAEGFWAGLEARVMSYSGPGGAGVDRFALGFSPRALASYDAREFFPKVPVRAHTYGGAHFDGTRNLVDPARITTTEEYALGAHRYHRMILGVGVEAPLPGVTPFAEYNLGYPVGVPNGLLTAPDGSRVAAGAAASQTLGLGVKVTALRDVTFLAAAELGLTRTVGIGVPATAPYNLFFGASFNVDAQHRPRSVQLVPRPLFAPAPTAAKVSGRVLDARTGEPVPGVLVATVGTGLPPVASESSEGRFLSHELPGGPIKLLVQKDGYRLVEREVVLAAGKTSVLDVLLEPSVKPARFAVTVTKEKTQPLAALLSFRGEEEHEVSLPASATPQRLELPAGYYVVNVTSPGFLAQTRELQVAEGAELTLAFDLAAEPKKKLVVVKKEKIEILQQVHFTIGKATILPDSFSLLAQVVDAIVRNDIQRVRVEGHTDNKGDKLSNLRLSQSRARAVAEHLTRAGIDAGRLEVAGFGDSRPVAPNLTPRGRELNRRVDFVILEQ